MSARSYACVAAFKIMIEQTKIRGDAGGSSLTFEQGSLLPSVSLVLHDNPVMQSEEKESKMKSNTSLAKACYRDMRMVLNGKMADEQFAIEWANRLGYVWIGIPEASLLTYQDYFALKREGSDLAKAIDSSIPAALSHVISWFGRNVRAKLLRVEKHKACITDGITAECKRNPVFRAGFLMGYRGVDSAFAPEDQELIFDWYHGHTIGNYVRDSLWAIRHRRS